LIAFLPVWVFFLCLVQLGLIFTVRLVTEHAATGGSVIHTPQERLELKIEIFIQAVDEILTSHGNRMTHHVPDRHFEAALDAPGLVKGHPT